MTSTEISEAAARSAALGLLLTGAIEGTKEAVRDYMKSFSRYDWLWKNDMNTEYGTVNIHLFTHFLLEMRENCQDFTRE